MNVCVCVCVCVYLCVCMCVCVCVCVCVYVCWRSACPGGRVQDAGQISQKSDL